MAQFAFAFVCYVNQTTIVNVMVCEDNLGGRGEEMLPKKQSDK